VQELLQTEHKTLKQIIAETEVTKVKDTNIIIYQSRLINDNNTINP
jgi:hypothetical protein